MALLFTDDMQGVLKESYLLQKNPDRDDTGIYVTGWAIIEEFPTMPRHFYSRLHLTLH